MEDDFYHNRLASAPTLEQPNADTLLLSELGEVDREMQQAIDQLVEVKEQFQSAVSQLDVKSDELEQDFSMLHVSFTQRLLALQSVCLK